MHLALSYMQSTYSCFCICLLNEIYWVHTSRQLYVVAGKAMPDSARRAHNYKAMEFLDDTHIVHVRDAIQTRASHQIIYDIHALHSLFTTR